jgi:dTDP-4-dehydrorhamnose reductase
MPLASFLDREHWLEGVETARIDTVAAAISRSRPDVVFNCIGIVKQLAEAHDAILSLEVNALFPHRLATLCDVADARLVHLSTDCVFSGDRGSYLESDNPDPVDLYGRTKLLGETVEGEALTIRTSIVGRQLSGHTSLFEWVLANRGNAVRGFDGAVYTGLTTMWLARVIEAVLTDHPDLSGVWQVASSPITKFDLLVELDRRLGLELTIDKDESFRCDRSLEAQRFVERTGIELPTWDRMLDDFVADQVTYESLPYR